MLILILERPWSIRISKSSCGKEDKLEIILYDANNYLDRSCLLAKIFQRVLFIDY